MALISAGLDRAVIAARTSGHRSVWQRRDLLCLGWSGRPCLWICHLTSGKGVNSGPGCETWPVVAVSPPVWPCRDGGKWPRSFAAGDGACCGGGLARWPGEALVDVQGELQRQEGVGGGWVTLSAWPAR